MLHSIGRETHGGQCSSGKVKIPIILLNLDKKGQKMVKMEPKLFFTCFFQSLPKQQPLTDR